ncbi:hypothetical protein Vretifemale_13463 [Volvox reticuliferus]|uniref:Uncharacterized protein n=1 Tax=Volvox reticuliferus TaxID=1737510 RepID=A0A8J4CN16_9CHLO|nr:hypothetical protein Vretifemale_13463 [Volvox reticuliferus]
MDIRQQFMAGGGGSGRGDRTPSEAAALISAAVAPTLDARADGTVVGLTKAGLPPSPPPSAPPPPHPLLLGPRVGLIEWLDLGPGRRFVKEHLGAVGHPVSMYTRGIGPIAHLMSRSLLSRHFSPKAYVNDP